MYKKIVAADITPEVLIKSIKNLVAAIEAEEIRAITAQVEYEGKKYSACMDISVVYLDSYELGEDVCEQIRGSNLTSEYLVGIIKTLVSYLKGSDQYMYKLPVPIGVGPVKHGIVPSIDLRVYETEEKNNASV